MNTILIENRKAMDFYNLLLENEFFNFETNYGEFYTYFIFENYTESEIETVEKLANSIN